MRKVIITGSEGLIGKSVKSFFANEGYKVVCCDISLGHDLTDESFVRDFFSNNRSDYLLNLFAFNDHVSSSNKSINLFDISLDSFS